MNVETVRAGWRKRLRERREGRRKECQQQGEAVEERGEWCVVCGEDGRGLGVG